MAGANLCLSLAPEIKESSLLPGVCGTSGSLELLWRQILRSLEWAWKVKSSPWSLVLCACQKGLGWGRGCWQMSSQLTLAPRAIPRSAPGLAAWHPGSGTSGGSFAGQHEPAAGEKAEEWPPLSMLPEVPRLRAQLAVVQVCIHRFFHPMGNSSCCRPCCANVLSCPLTENP